MIPYLIRKYLLNAIGVSALFAALPIALTESNLPEAIADAFFWSGLFAGGITYWEFKRQNIWPLYDNVRLPKFILLGLLVGIHFTASVIIKICLA